jgi:hypothetical protein
MIIFEKKFKKTKENFVCENCGKKIIGNGYTNHCPHCLYSKHVDIFPGDRENPCKGLMKPIKALLKNGQYTIIHRCEICREEKKNKLSKEDNLNEILNLF